MAEWTVFLTGITLAGLALWPEYVADFLLAYLLGIVCHDFSRAPRRGLGLKEGLIAAVKADTLSLTAFAVGLFGWMVLTSFVFFQHHLHPDSPVSWFMMQVGMVIGCATAYPMTWWLLKMGIKRRCSGRATACKPSLVLSRMGGIRGQCRRRATHSGAPWS